MYIYVHIYIVSWSFKVDGLSPGRPLKGFHCIYVNFRKRYIMRSLPQLVWETFKTNSVCFCIFCTWMYIYHVTVHDPDMICLYTVDCC